MLMGIADSGAVCGRVFSMAEILQFMPFLNMGYAIVIAMLLFGDFYNSRMCNALHALPLRRECWFSTHVLSGLAFSIVPNLVMALICLLLCAGTAVYCGWQMPLYWLLGNTLQFVTFFGIAVFSIFCAGSRFAALVVYGIMNFASVLVYILSATVYTPMLYGTYASEAPFLRLCPVVQMMQEEYFHTEQIWAEIYPPYVIGGTFSLTEHWGSLWIWAAVGAALIVAALLLYRKRHLETAGDFIAVKAFRPVFLIIYTLCAGVALYCFQRLFLGITWGYVWLFIGLAVGFFTGLMLLERTVRVFRKKNFALCGALLLAFGLTLVATALDIFGIESWMPEKSEIKSVTVYDQHVYSAANYKTLSGAKLDADTGLRLHELALKEQQYFDDTDASFGYYFIDDLLLEFEDGASGHAVSFTLVYELDDGRRVSRYYYGFAESEIGQILRPCFSTPEQVLGFPEDQIPAFVAGIDEILLDGECVTLVLDENQRLALMEAIVADCKAGTMIQHWAFHPTESQEEPAYYLEIQHQDLNSRYYNWLSITVFPECTNTRAFIEEAGLLEYEPPLDGPLG